MKKILLLAAVAAFGFSSCSQDEVVENVSTKQAIGFDTYIGRAVENRAASTTPNYITSTSIASMNVSAIYTGNDGWESYVGDKDAAAFAVQNFMNNTYVTKTEGNWGYSPVKYWPDAAYDSKAQKISFFALANGSTDETNKATISETGTYTYTQPVQTTEAPFPTQIDLLHASTRDVTKGVSQENKTDAEGDVLFKFNHTLVRVGFGANSGLTVAADHKATKFHIDEIKFGSTDNATILNSNTLTAIQKNAGFTWADASALGENKICYTLDADDFQTEATTLLGNTADTYTKINDEDAYMLLLPYNYSTGTGIPVTVKYTVYVHSGDTEVTTENKTASYTNVKTITIKPNFSTAGQAYRVNLTVLPDAIKFDGIEVNDWTGSDNETSVSGTVDQ